MKGLSIVLIIFIVRCAHSFNFIKIPQVFTGEIDFPRIPELMNAGKGQATSHISHTVQFTSTPQILLAINNMDISTDNTNFQATISSSDSNQFSLVLQKDCDAIIYALNIQYLAINIKDSFVLTGHFNFQENIYTCDPNWMCAKQTFMYQKSNFDSQKWKVTIGFYFIGLEKVQLQNSGYGLSFLNDIAYHSNSFDIIIKTRDRNVYSKINKIYYNYIEIYQQINNSYYYISNIRDDSINPINTGNPMTLPGSSGSPPRYSYIPTDKFNIDVTSGIFLGITGLECIFNTLRFSVQTQQQNQVDLDYYSYQNSYSTWWTSQVIGGQAQFMVFAQVNCNINNLYFLDDQYQCVSSCPDGYYLAHTPDPIYNINLNQCLACDDSCKTCNGPTPQSCLSCSKAYLLNNMCYKIRPNNTYCDQNNNCKGCTKIQNDQTTPMCKFCDITLMNCLLCYNPNQYLYKQICYVERPISTYCDSQNICEDCFINCQSCYQTTSKDCLSCKQPFLFYQNQCICPDLSQTYNIETKQCEFKELSVFPQETQQKLQDGGNALNQVSFGLSVGFTIAQGFIRLGCPLLSQTLTSQKIFYLELINISTPQFLLQFIKSISKILCLIFSNIKSVFLFMLFEENIPEYFVQSMKIPQVITGEIDFMQIPELQKAGTGQATSHIYHTNQFTSTPQILLALSYIDFVMGDTIFQATINSSNSTHFSLLLQKYGKTNLYRLKFQYLAINIKDCFVITGNFNFQENIYTCDPNWICAKQTFMYQKSNYDSQKQNVTVGFYFIGLDKVQLQNKGYSLSFLNEIVYNSNSFDIIIKTSDQNIKSQIKKIYYNYIEIYQQINSSYYYISNVRDNSINPIGSSNPLTSSSFGPRYSQFPTYKFNIDVTSGIFLGITGVICNSDQFRFSVLTQQQMLIDLNYYSYQNAYRTWADTQIKGGQAQIMVFAQVNCNINNLYFLDDQYQCVSSCPDGYYLAHTPDPIYKITLNQCLSCDASCKTCNGPTPQSCLSCSKAYLLNSMCYKLRPNYTYCDENNNCKKCTKMQSDQTTPMCNICDITLTNCLQCYNPNQYLYKQICYVERPIRTYCNSTNTCEDCFINCESCYQTTSKDCLSCMQPFVLYKNQCICPDLSQTYNVETKQCEFKEISMFSQGAQKKFQNGGNAVNQIQDILLTQLANSSILQKASCRIYMIIFQIFENIMFPLVVVSFKSSYVCQMCTLIAIQAIEFIITLHIRPFQNKLYQCVSSCPDGYYLAHTPDPIYKITLNQCLACGISCKTCDGNAPQICLQCNQAYLLNSMCYKIRPNNTYCDENNNCKECTKMQSDQTTPMCNICDITLMNCLQCYNPNQYLYNQICYVERPIRTYCDSKNTCEDCFVNCESCYQTTSQDCLSCKKPFVLHQNQCICSDLSQTYNIETKQCEFKEPSVFPQDTQKKLQNGGKAVNQASFGMSIGFTILQGFTTTGCALLSQTLTRQKIFYLELISIIKSLQVLNANLIS
ncbi:hypothetical protein ABPG73_018193 [Tetrahymena malaccensis]